MGFTPMLEGALGAGLWLVNVESSVPCASSLLRVANLPRAAVSIGTQHSSDTPADLPRLRAKKYAWTVANWFDHSDLEIETGISNEYRSD